ncbi:hypothetical protein RQP46_009828 [Phenoliferia psychrophenolica]
MPLKRWQKITLLVLAAAIGITIACTPLILPAIGFGAGGIVAGSVAAGIQAGFLGGAVPAGSLFALLQSIGALGAPGAFIGIGTTISVGAIAALSWDYCKDALVRFFREGEGARLLELITGGAADSHERLHAE